MGKKGVTKQLSAFTIDKDVLREFDRLTINNEKSSQVERIIKQLIEKYPNGIPTTKYGWVTSKRGQHHINRGAE